MIFMLQSEIHCYRNARRSLRHFGLVVEVEFDRIWAFPWRLRDDFVLPRNPFLLLYSWEN